MGNGLSKKRILAMGYGLKKRFLLMGYGLLKMNEV